MSAMDLSGDPAEQRDEDMRRIVEADHDWIRRRFLEDSPRPPRIVWNPDADSMPFPPLKAFVQCWRAMPREIPDALPHIRDFDIVDFRKSMRYFMYLDVVDAGADFRYRVYGTGISSISGFDLTGTLLSEARIPAVTRDFMLACYRAVVSRREPLFTEHHPPVNFKITTWSRAIAPLVDDSGAVARIVAVNYPEWLPDPEKGIKPLPV